MDSAHRHGYGDKDGSASFSGSIRSRLGNSRSLKRRISDTTNDDIVHEDMNPFITPSDIKRTGQPFMATQSKTQWDDNGEYVCFLLLWLDLLRSYKCLICLYFFDVRINRIRGDEGNSLPRRNWADYGHIRPVHGGRREAP